MDLEQKRSELEAQIEAIQGDIEAKVAELDEVRSLLSKDSFASAHKDELDDEDFVADEGDDEDIEETTTEEEDFEDEDLDGSTGGEAELKEKESMLMEEVLVLQMKATALTKQLNDVLAQQGMNSLGESEE